MCEKHDGVFCWHSQIKYTCSVINEVVRQEEVKEALTLCGISGLICSLFLSQACYTYAKYLT